MRTLSGEGWISQPFTFTLVISFNSIHIFYLIISIICPVQFFKLVELLCSLSTFPWQQQKYPSGYKPAVGDHCSTASQTWTIGTIGFRQRTSGGTNVQNKSFSCGISSYFAFTVEICVKDGESRGFTSTKVPTDIRPVRFTHVAEFEHRCLSLCLSMCCCRWR